MKKLLTTSMQALGYGLLMMLPGILVFTISAVAPPKIWSRMEHESEAQYAQRLQLQAIAFRARMHP